MQRLREQDGIALITATILLTIVLGLAVALLSFADNQQHASAREQAHEVAYSLAEAALNAQISKLGAQWASSTEWTTAPSSCALSGGSYPSGCVCNNTTTFTGCPSSTGSWQSSVGYTTSGTSWCPPGTRTDAWGSSPTSSWSNVSNGWTTYVRDDGTYNGTSTSSLFNSSADQYETPYDANNDGDVWVRSVATYHCQTSILLSKVAEQLVPITFPRYAVTANSFATLNNGNKTMMDMAGIYAQPSDKNTEIGKISTRCSGLGSSACTSFRSGQISPDTCGASSTSPYGCSDYASTSSQTLSATDLTALKAEAITYGTYFSSSSTNGCPTSLSRLSSVSIPGGVAPVYVDSSCGNLSFTGGTANSSSQPGFLVLTTQTLTLNGNATFYGLIYDANLCTSGGTTSPCTTSSVMVTVHGSASVQGAINVDGAGAVAFGDSGNGNNSTTNFIYDDRIFADLTEFGGADATPNSFRQLPTSQ